MVLELHIWGPAFSLPSIDPHCLAAIAYLQQAVPPGEWQLVASSNPTLSPTNELPALRDGERWIGGFRNIIHYIAQVSQGQWVLDAGLSEQEAADCIAFSSFVESQGQPLLDLSLYVSSENYAGVTRPLYNTIQPFPLPYLTPPSIRAAAKLRTEHLGLSGLDIDSEEGSPKDNSIIPASLRTPRTTVSSLLATTPEINARIRLDALAQNFLGPLQDLLGEKRYLVSERQFSSLDCLALGYLSLMLLPELPQPWLAKSVRAHSPQLCTWTQDLSSRIFGPAVTPAAALLTSSSSSNSPDPSALPWKTPNTGGLLGITTTYLTTLADSLPVLGQHRLDSKMRRQNANTKTPTRDLSPPSSWPTVTLLGGLLAGVASLAVLFLKRGLFEEEETRGGQGLDAFGEAGAALSFLADQMDEQVRRDRGQTVGGEVDVVVGVEGGL